MKRGNSKRSQKSRSIKDLFELLTEETSKDKRPKGEGWLNAKEIAEELNLSITTARVNSNKLVEMGHMEKVKSGACHWYRQT